MWKWILGVLLVVVLTVVGGGVWFVSSGQLSKMREMFDPSKRATFVRVEEVKRGDLVRVVSAPGTIEPQQKVDISAQVSARIVAMPYREGAVVRKGEVVVRLDADDLQASLNSVKASLRSEEARLAGAKASLENATADLARKRELFATKDISKAELDQSEAEYLRAQSTHNQVTHAISIAKANIDRAEKNLSYTVITAPFDGVVTDARAEVGELVVVGTLNNPGSVIMQIADLNSMIVKARVDETNIAPVKIGQKAKIYINAFPNRVFTGTVEVIQPLRIVDRDGTAYFQTEIRLDVPEDVAIYSGMTANVDIEVEHFDNVIKVPSQAVVERLVEELPSDVLRESGVVDRNKKWARVVYAFEDGKARVVPVSAGPSDLTDTVIVTGLQEGERIVVGPFKALVSLRDDQTLTDREPGKNGEAKPEAVAGAAAGSSGTAPSGSQASSQGGTQGGSQAGSQTGSSTGNQAGTKAGSQTAATSGGGSGATGKP